MLLFIEGYPYKLDHKIREDLTVEDALSGVVSHFNKKKTYTPEYVGYCYSKAADDVIFFLPKVVLTGKKTKNEQHSDKIPDTIFGADPLKIIDFESEKLEENFTEYDKIKYKEFLSELSIWIYRSISVYKKEYNDNILESREIQSKTSGRKVKHNTLLDVIIALRDFYRHNQDYLTFIVKNVHSGFNKINWTKTISKSQAIVTNGAPVYLDPVNKKKVVNFDEELLVIYFSILNYIREIHGFSFDININYNLISTKVLKSKYIDRKYGTRRLRQIKYKYFSDKALRIWDLCYAFFDREHKITMKVPEDDFLLAKDFQRIFELMIDKLVGGNEKEILPRDLTNQKDGKLVDHMYIDKGLLINSEFAKELTYYIGDSKYYKRDEEGKVSLHDTSIYKQYTYARNVVQWNMNMFLGLQKRKYGEQPQLRDDFTEGYNPIPNFFISAHIPDRKNSSEGKFLSFEDDALHNENNIQLNRQFENRLFDRDTLLLCHYDVNFLFIVSLYGRDNKNRQAEWREKVRKVFRKSIQETLNSLYDFYTLQPKAGMDCYGFIKENFHNLNGKIYRPQEKGNYLILALMKGDAKDKGVHFGTYTLSEIGKNNALKTDLESYFHVSKIQELKEDLVIEDIPNVGTLEKNAVTCKKNGVLMVMMENYDAKCKNFLSAGVIAVALKDTLESKEIIENLFKIRYILFHTWKEEGKHLFMVENINIVAKGDVSSNVYKTIKPENENVTEYALVSFNNDFELMSDSLHPISKSGPTRYDAQYSILENLKTELKQQTKIE
jgi:hypothetical protein